MKVKTPVIALLALFGTTAVVSTASLGYVWRKVRAFDRAHGSDVLAGVAGRAAARPSPAASAAKKRTRAAEPPTNRFVRVLSSRIVNRDQVGSLEIEFTHMPKLDDLRRGVRIEPAVAEMSVVEGDDGCFYDSFSRKWCDSRKMCFRSKNFRFGTPYTVTVKKDLRFEGGESLEKEQVRELRRPDFLPEVSLVHSGRYLPPVGNRTLVLDTVNISHLDCTTWRVLPENIVQLLAREEAQYDKGSHRWWGTTSADGEETAELAAAPYGWRETYAPATNAWVKRTVTLRTADGDASRGVYLLHLHDGDFHRGEFRSEPGEYRLVCVSDIGLSARQDEGGVRVWTTSLTTGRPMADLAVRLYAGNRMLLAEGKTDRNGEIVLSGWDARYTPFALVAFRPDRSDVTFMALRDSMKIDEPLPSGVRPKYLAARECRAFVWTERGIYRHGERIMVHALLRDGRGDAPEPFPVVALLEDAEGREVARTNVLSDAYGAVRADSFAAPAHLPSGTWKVKVELPDRKKTLLGEREIKIEEFAPPQVRVTLKDLPTAASGVTCLVFKVAAEHLFGGPAKKITAEALVSFADADFAPEGWKGFRFGDASRALAPNYTRLKRVFTDDRGEATFATRLLPEWGEPKSAVRLTVQGSVFETGGRPSFSRASVVLHKYPYYLGSNVPRYLRQRHGAETFTVVQVDPDGRAHGEARTLKAQLWKVERVYNLVQGRDGGSRWESQQVRHPVEIDGTVAVGADGSGAVKIPLSGSGDYELAVEDAERGLSHTAAFWISSTGDDEERAALANPTAVSLAADRPLYREGDRPRLTLKCPFRGFAWLSVLREKTLYTRVVEVTNLTQTVVLDPVDGAWAPNVDVAVSLVQSVLSGKDHLACRAHGILPLKIRTRDSELPAKVTAAVTCAPRGGSTVTVAVDARGERAAGERAVVTVVDEGINLLTGEKVPDPIGWLSAERGAWHPLYDLYRRLLPALAGPRAGGVKTGGDDFAGMMNRVSPVPVRRFKPLSRWQFDVPLANGVGEATFALPEFVGEVRVTALVYNRRATGCGAVRQKVSPKLVMQPDAPRFAAPGDEFFLTLSLFNRSGRDGTVDYAVSASGAVELREAAQGRVTLADGDSAVLNIRAAARSEIGQGALVYRTRGFGETHEETIEVPVRPAVPWDERSEVVALRPGETFVSTPAAEIVRRTISVRGSPVAELGAACDYLAEYPHGCLEQTTSRMFPLLYGTGRKADSGDVLKAGVSRVVSMMRETDFTMWPDCNCPPWDPEVSPYAAHFLVEAGTFPGLGVGDRVTGRVCSWLKRWAFAADTNLSVYACHTLALAGRPEKDRMYALYDVRDRLSLLSRARLARAFVRIGDPVRAHALVADGASDPKSVREAAFALLSLLEMDAHDARLPKLVLYLQKHRDRKRLHWGTTGENAHALLALGAYYRATGVREGPVKVTLREGTGEAALKVGETFARDGGGDIVLRNGGDGDAYLALRTLELPEPSAVTNRHRRIGVTRRFMTSEGFEADLANLTRGELLIGEIVLTADRDYAGSDLVVQELLPACFEPDRPEVADVYARCHGHGRTDWVLRSDMRDDRVLAFSRPVTLHPGLDGAQRIVFYYAVRVITPGAFVLPGTGVEAMYAPEIGARNAPERICVRP